MNNKFAAAIATVCLSGCATNGGPLVFVVTESIGVDIQAASTSSATPGLTFGYKSVNLAVVPIQMRTDGGAQLRGCYSVAQEGATIPTSCVTGNGSNSGTPPVPAAKPSTYRRPDAGTLDNVYFRDTRSSPDAAPRSEFVPVVAAAAAPPPQPSSTGTPAQAAATPFAESVQDAYSVYATFNAKVKASGSGSGVDVGQVFATGDAAVQLAEGANYFASRNGNAKIVLAQAQGTCVAQLIAAKNAGVDMSKVPACPSSQAGTTPNPLPTLATIAPTSGSAPASGATTGTKVPVTLTGTGFNSASKLTITGNAGVTADQLTASSDGKTLTTTLTIAPAAAKGACTVAVTNPAPGGGTSPTVSFTVN
jgi:hypothetical protein